MRIVIASIFVQLCTCHTRTCHTKPILSVRYSYRRFLTTSILSVGKKNSVEPWIADGCDEYEKRITPVVNVQTIFFKSDELLIECLSSIRGKVVALDENGEEFSSREFSKFYYKLLEDGGAHVTFIIGGFAGLPQDVRRRFPLISIGKMTWTHQMARLLLLEQIYRAIEIRKGSGYHKD